MCFTIFCSNKKVVVAYFDKKYRRYKELKHYYNFRLEDVYAKLNTSEKGLTSDEANARIQRNGKNVLEEGKSKTWLQRFFAQMKELLRVSILTLLMRE